MLIFMFRSLLGNSLGVSELVLQNPLVSRYQSFWQGNSCYMISHLNGKPHGPPSFFSPALSVVPMVPFSAVLSSFIPAVGPTAPPLSAPLATSPERPSSQREKLTLETAP
jgi:hypothetical protein